MPKTPKVRKSSSTRSSSGSDYEVGYGRPPVKNQFKPGNELGKGRPKGRKNEATIINEVLQRRITLTENGKPNRMTWEEAMWTQQGKLAVKGDSKSTALLSDRKRDAERLKIDSDDFSPEDQKVFETSLEKILERRAKDAKK